MDRGQVLEYAGSDLAGLPVDAVVFATVTALDKSGRGKVEISCDASADLLGELHQWLAISAASHEGPWQRARHFSTSLTSGASHASSVGWGGGGGDGCRTLSSGRCVPARMVVHAHQQGDVRLVPPAAAVL